MQQNRRRRRTTKTTTKTTTKRQNTTLLEREEQALLFEWAGFASVHTHPELALMYHIPNGGSRNAIEARNLRSQGVRAGVPDICLPVPKGIYGALYIELKRRKDGRTSEAQREWIATLNRAGNKAVVCRGFEEAKNAIEEYLSN